MMYSALFIISCGFSISYAVHVPMDKNHPMYKDVALRPISGRTNEAFEWCYLDPTCGPSQWAANFEFCGGSSQSPVNLTNSLVNTHLGGFTFTNFINKPAGASWTILNNGHTVEVKLNPLGAYRVAGGGLKAGYTGIQFHFHWGSISSQGSEHAVEGRKFPMEMHLVQFRDDINGQFENIDTANDRTAGHVIGVFFEISPVDNPLLKPLIDAVRRVEEEEVEYPMEVMKLVDLLPKHLNQFYRYEGSLTTPGCFEIVQWTLMRECVLISEAQMDAFRALPQRVSDNFRPLQPIGTRLIHRNFVY